MKRCPRCGRTYTDNDLNFCLDDGELLAYDQGSGQAPPFKDDSPPTIIMDSPRVTNPIGWQASQPIQPWLGANHPAGQRTPFSTYQGSRDQTLPTISLILGVLSITLICCFGGFYVGIPAAIVGFIGMRNADSDPERYGGRGMAIAGMVIGIITFLFAIFHIILTTLGNL